MNIFMDNFNSGQFSENQSVVRVSTVFQNLNITGLHALESWCKGLNVRHYYHKLTQPGFLKSHVLPESVKNKVYEHSLVSENSDYLTREMMQPYTEEEKNAFIEYITKKDKIRGVNILDYCPEFEEWF